MSAFAELRDQVADLNGRFSAAMSALASKADVRRVDHILQRFIERSGRSTFGVPLRDIEAATTESKWVLHTHTWDSSYDTGGEPISIEGLVDSFSHALIETKAGYTFWYDAVNDKLLSFDSGGVETPNGTDLATRLTSSQVTVFGTDTTLVSSTILPVYVASGNEIVTGVTLTAATGVTASSSNYWTIRPRRRAVGQEFGEEIGDGLVTEKVGLEARVAHPLYSSETGTRLSEGDVVLLDLAPASVSAATIEKPVVGLTIQRRAS